MIDDELMKKFDSIEDLPISEEMLGAYLEGNLTPSESEFVQNEIDSDLTLMNLSHSALYDYVEPTVFFDSSLIDSIELPILIDEDLITDDSYLDYVPSMNTIDTDFSFELPDIEDDFLSDLDNDETTE